ncbi:MAG: hypothetical protein CME70_18645, partial [Halobacteriovorax sp.]|nr:hypothetical protein [Halobacteriovorax sp.]
MANPKDFFAKQIRVTHLIASGSYGDNFPGLMIYSSSTAIDYEGGLTGGPMPGATPTMLHDDTVGDSWGSSDGLVVGSDVYLFVSGTQASPEANQRWDLPVGVNPAVVLFGGDVVISGTLYAERQVIEVDLSHEGELFVSGNVTMQDQTSG